jgi:hypothetical protein
VNVSNEPVVTIEHAPAGVDTSKAVDKSGSKVRGMFAEIAPRYDLVNRMLSGGIDVWWRHVTVSRAAPPRSGARRASGRLRASIPAASRAEPIPWCSIRAWAAR